MATLRDVYRWIGQGDNRGFEASDPTANDSLNGRWVPGDSGQEAGGGGYWQPNDQFLAQLNKDYGVGTYQRQEGGGEAGGPLTDRLAIDPTNLPRSRIGDVSRTAPVFAETNLYNPNAVVDDPLYGRITPGGNIRSTNEWLGPVLMAAMSMGMGALMTPAIAGAAASGAGGAGAGGAGAAGNIFNSGRLGLAGVNAARTLGSGGSPVSAALSLATPFAPVLGIDPDILTGGRTAYSLSQLARRRG